jgi:hypothetical protein
MRFHVLALTFVFCLQHSVRSAPSEVADGKSLRHQPLLRAALKQRLNGGLDSPPLSMQGLPAISSAISAIAVSTASAVAALPLSAASAAWSAILSRTRFIYRDGTAADLFSVQRRDGLLRCLLIGHLDKTEASRLARELVAHDGDAFHCSELREFGLQLFFRNFEIEIAHEDVSHRSVLTFPASSRK